MIILRVQNGPHCLLYSAAMVLNLDPKILKEEIGHDGNDIWWPEADLPVKRIRSFHIQEIADVFFKYGYALSCIEVLPRSAPEGYDSLWKLADTEEKLKDRFQSYLKLKHNGILIGARPSGLLHAVAWDGENQVVCDPAPPFGRRYGLAQLDLAIGMYYMATKIIKS